HQRPLVVGVDQPDQVAEHDAVLRAQARARQDHRGVLRVADMDGDAGRHELAVAGIQDDFFFNTSSKIEPRRAGAGVMRQHAADPLVEDLDLQLSHLSRVATCSIRRRASSSLGPCPRAYSPLASYRVMALSSRPMVSCAMFAAISGSFFFASFALAFSARFSLSAAKPTQ